MAQSDRIILWADIKILVDNLRVDITRSEFEPQLIIAFNRGGLIPGVMLSHKLGVPLHPHTHNQQAFENAYWQSLDRILIIDDINDSGKTFKEFEVSTREAQERDNHVINNKAQWKTATLYSKEDSCYSVDFNGELIPRADSKWLVFPWEE